MVERTKSEPRSDAAGAPEPPSAMPPGTLVDGRYRIVSHLGEGGMGTVLIAEHVGLGRQVALKVLQEHIGHDPTTHKRFQREARTLAAMSHPNIVAMNDYGIWEGKPYLVMELLAGRTLRDLLDVEKVLPIERALDIAQQVLRALAYAHAQGAIHRDLKPGNVFLQALPDQIDHVKLLDFGFAKFLHQPASSFVSADGIIVGTPAYMAPEQAGGKVDHRADVYGAGVLLFEMLSGRRPFEGEPLEMIRGRLVDDAPKLAEVRPGIEIEPALEDALARALARRPEDRYQSASELASALARVTRDALRPAGTVAP
nr:serine/threonine protein kinase [Myxococcota bacterium]